MRTKHINDSIQNEDFQYLGCNVTIIKTRQLVDGNFINIYTFINIQVSNVTKSKENFKILKKKQKYHKTCKDVLKRLFLCKKTDLKRK